MGSVKKGGLTLTDGNSKMGRVMNISLPPRLSCDTSMPCFSARRCYALKHAYLPYGEVRAAWDGNYAVWCGEGPAAYFGAVKEAVAERRPALFRWHVGGDIPDRFPERGTRTSAGWSTWRTTSRTPCSGRSPNGTARRGGTQG